MRVFIFKITCAFIFCLSFNGMAQQEHPSLILTKSGVADIQKSLGTIPLLDASIAQMKSEIEAAMKRPIEVPVPKDYSGGYTHEQHKLNYSLMKKSGLLFQILGEEKYAVYLREMFMAYVALYPTLDIHPKERSYARGKLFWQCLNDSNWLVSVSQAYDYIYEWLPVSDRSLIETKLLRPFADHISIDNPQFFNRVHNHSTWGNVAVGMLGLVLADDALIDRALYGLDASMIDYSLKDNDGGFLFVAGQKAGYFANLDEPFSPDGYYTEGPYYQRYAMYPFLIFAQALNNVRPELGVFKYKDGVLIKSVSALLQLTNANGDFFAINDAQKGMSYYSEALVNAVDIAYLFGGENPALLDIARLQNKVVINDAGLAVARGLAEQKEVPFLKKSLSLSDGAQGDQGAINILRNEGMELVHKNTAQGLSHGHYDKLSYFLNSDGAEIIQDYGLARFVNIEQKGGGNYLKENKSWAKQTIAHNTLVQDEKSHYGGRYEIGSQYAPDLYSFDNSNPDFQWSSSKENNAYPGTELHRTLVLFRDPLSGNSMVLDLFRVHSEQTHQYDLPLYYQGQIIDFDFKIKSENVLTPLGSANGYEHIFKEGSYESKGESLHFSWLKQSRYYTLTSLIQQGDEIILGQIGANDPQYNLRRDPLFLHRKKEAGHGLFASIIERHGSYSPVSELSKNAVSAIGSIQKLMDNAAYTAVKINFKDGRQYLVLIANEAAEKELTHELEIANKLYSWKGPINFQQL